ncbi:transcriptional regulator [Cutibacterium acnes JCM 18916]|nr:transcriptional regulator [Cutibacterium acnes JCM 18916]
MLFFSVGALDSPVPSHVYSAGYMTDEEKANLVHAGVVGDVNTVFLKLTVLTTSSSTREQPD